DVGRFLDKGPKRCAALLIARREDLHDGDDLPASVSNHNAVGPFPVVDTLDFGDQPRGRRSRGDGNPAFKPSFWLVSLERDDIRNRTTGDLLRHRHITGWKQPGVQGVADRDHPALVKIVKITSFDSSPVVNRHAASPWVASILPWPDRRGKFPRLAIPITQVLLPTLVRSEDWMGPPTLWHQRQLSKDPLSPVLDGRAVWKCLVPQTANARSSGMSLDRSLQSTSSVGDR